ncbi:hypothetical protein EVAR_15702_1 [Eumeta japonica]|uniref:Uncharacterized protein n=1 Tax=Eumeta variegata TaxID=151549 RepID=A0A4C1U9P6_EUMVA|nr:hypothetical protein EVAR_15702_1 [Eumeta japonica]
MTAAGRGRPRRGRGGGPCAGGQIKTYLKQVYEPTRLVQYHGPTEYRREVTVSTLVHHIVSEGFSGSLLSISSHPLFISSLLSSSVYSFFHQISYSYPRGRQRTGNSSEITSMSMGSVDYCDSFISSVFSKPPRRRRGHLRAQNEKNHLTRAHASVRTSRRDGPNRPAGPGPVQNI